VAALRVKAPSERDVRLAAGLTMFSYVTCHFISHATGLFRLAGIQAIGHDIVLAPWRTPVGLAILLSACGASNNGTVNPSPNCQASIAGILRWRRR
jgi:hypothetical protein